VFRSDEQNASGVIRQSLIVWPLLLAFSFSAYCELNSFSNPKEKMKLCALFVASINGKFTVDLAVSLSPFCLSRWAGVLCRAGQV